MAEARIIPGETCPACGTRYNFGTDANATRVYGRDYRYRNILNKVFKCNNCGNIHSWNVKEGT